MVSTITKVITEYILEELKAKTSEASLSWTRLFGTKYAKNVKHSIEKSIIHWCVKLVCCQTDQLREYSEDKYEFSIQVWYKVYFETLWNTFFSKKNGRVAAGLYLL